MLTLSDADMLSQQAWAKMRYGRTIYSENLSPAAKSLADYLSSDATRGQSARRLISLLRASFAPDEITAFFFLCDWKNSLESGRAIFFRDWKLMDRKPHSDSLDRLQFGNPQFHRPSDVLSQKLNISEVAIIQYIASIYSVNTHNKIWQIIFSLYPIQTSREDKTLDLSKISSAYKAMLAKNHEMII